MIAIYEQNLVALELMPMLKPVATLHRLIPKRENEKPRFGGKVTSLSEIIIGVLCPPGWLRAGHYTQPRWHHPRPVVSWLSNMTINAGPSRPANSIHFTLSRAALMWDTLGRCHWDQIQMGACWVIGSIYHGFTVFFTVYFAGREATVSKCSNFPPRRWMFPPFVP